MLYKSQIFLSTFPIFLDQIRLARLEVYMLQKSGLQAMHVVFPLATGVQTKNLSVIDQSLYLHVYQIHGVQINGQFYVYSNGISRDIWYLIYLPLCALVSADLPHNIQSIKR